MIKLQNLIALSGEKSSIIQIIIDGVSRHLQPADIRGNLNENTLIYTIQIEEDTTITKPIEQFEINGFSTNLLLTFKQNLAELFFKAVTTGGGGGGGSQNLQQVCSIGNEYTFFDTGINNGLNSLTLSPNKIEVSKESGVNVGKSILTKGNLNFFTFNAQTIDFNTSILPAVKPVGNNVPIFATEYSIPYKESPQTFAMVEDINVFNNYTLTEVNTGSFFLGDAIYKQTFDVSGIVLGDQITVFNIIGIKDIIKHETILSINEGDSTQINNGATLTKTNETLRLETLPYKTDGSIFLNGAVITGYLTIFYTKQSL